MATVVDASSSSSEAGWLEYVEIVVFEFSELVV
jgi:hypothetical protein